MTSKFRPAGSGWAIIVLSLTALALAGTEARSVFYTDDRADLIKKARAMGIKAFQFTGYEGLREQLAKFGINV